MPHYSPNMGNRAYWLERMADRDAAARLDEDRLINQLNSLYRQSFREIRREINDWYNTYSTDNSITLQEAQRLLSPIELRQYQQHTRTLRAIYNESHNPFILEQLNRLQNRAYITRQMALLDAIDRILIETSHNVQISLEDHLINIYQREYRETLEALNIADFVVTPVSAVKEIIEYPYAGAMYSERIWRNKNQLINFINDDLTKAIIKGVSIQNMSKDLMDRCNTLYYQAERLVRTETNYVMTQGHKNGYKDAGLIEFEFSAHIDARTSPQCRRMDRQVFLIDESVVGTNTPPLHPFAEAQLYQ